MLLSLFVIDCKIDGKIFEADNKIYCHIYDCLFIYLFVTFPILLLMS